MAIQTVEHVRKREASLRAALADKGEAMDPVEKRRARKKLRRAQRKRRRLVVVDARKKQPEKAPAEAPPIKETAAAPVAEAAPAVEAEAPKKDDEAKSDG